MQLVILDEAQKERYAKDILALLTLSDNDFLPPLSARTSTTQTALQPLKSNDDGITFYHKEMMQQEILGALDGDVLLGFVSYKHNFSNACIDEKYFPNVYLSTLVLHPSARGKRLTAKFYDYLFNEVFPTRNIFTRTWSTNGSHLHILQSFDFKEWKRIPNDRGEGIDTVYYALLR